MLASKSYYILLIMGNLVKQMECGKKPVFRESALGSGQYFIYENNSADLDCEATGDPKPNITWYTSWNMKIIDCNDRDYDCNGYWLSVKNNPKDGKYKCKVCNEHGCIFRNLNINHYFNRITGPMNGVRLSDNAFLECSIRNQENDLINIDSNIIWFKHNSKNIKEQESEQLIEQIQYENQLNIFNSQNYSSEEESFYGNYNVKKLKTSEFGMSVLTFRAISSNVEGWYTCVAGINDNTIFHAKSFHLKVFSDLEMMYPMTTTIPAKSNLEIEENFSLIVSCAWNRSDTPNITWLHNDKAINCNENKQILCTELSVVIENVDVTDAGAYKCFTCNATDCSADPLQQFSVKVSENKHLYTTKILPNNQRAQVKSTVQFTCEIVAKYGEYSIEWLKFTNKKKAMEILSKLDIYWTFKIDRIRYLKFYEKFNIIVLNIQTKTLELSDLTLDNEAWYACCVYDLSSQQIKSAYLAVEVAPIFEKLSENQVAYVDERYAVKCIAFGKPKPTLKWYYNGVEVLDNDLEPYTGNEIVRTEVSIDQGGVYKCIASNFWGSIEHTFLVVVIYPYFRYYSQTPLELKLTSSPKAVGLLTNNMTIQCRISEPIIGTVLWLKIMQRNVTQHMLNLIFSELNVSRAVPFQEKYKDLIDILNITTLKALSYDNELLQSEQLHLSKLSSNDEGWYACIFFMETLNAQVFTYSRTYYKSFYLRVLNETFPKFRTISTVNSYEIAANETLKLNCSAMGRPKPDIGWYHNGTSLKCLEGHIICKDFQLVLLNAGLNDSGRYTCNVSNVHGYIQREIQVRVLSKPSNQVTSVQTNSVIIIYISSTIVVLLVIGVSVVIYLCVKRDRKNKALLKTAAETVHKWTKIVVVRWPEVYVPDNECESITPIIEIEQKEGKPVRCPEEEYLYEHNAHWEILRTNIVLGAMLGEGSFGQVVMGRSTNFQDTCGSPIEIVAVKMLKNDPSETEVKNLVHELEIMKVLGKHINIISFLGCCSQGGPLWLIMEYAQHGNLKNFLRNYKNNLTEDEKYVNFEAIALERFHLNIGQLISFAYQIARGMDYLHSKRFIHRDLAARNILVASDYIMKIADFGLARELQLYDYYRRDENNLLPIKWMAPEALDDQKFTRATDIWSYGILLWEIMSFGAEPYEEISSIVSLFALLLRGERLAMPDNCSNYIYEMMQSCWNINPKLRPKFTEIFCKLRSLVENNLNDSNYLELE